MINKHKDELVGMIFHDTQLYKKMVQILTVSKGNTFSQLENEFKARYKGAGVSHLHWKEVSAVLSNDKEVMFRNSDNVNLFVVKKI